MTQRSAVETSKNDEEKPEALSGPRLPADGCGGSRGSPEQRDRPVLATLSRKSAADVWKNGL